MFGGMDNNCGCEIVYWKDDEGIYWGKAITANCASQFGTEVKKLFLYCLVDIKLALERIIKMQSEIKAAMEALTNAISVMDVNASIADEDVKLWNDIIDASKELRKVIEKSPGD